MIVFDGNDDDDDDDDDDGDDMTLRLLWRPPCKKLLLHLPTKHDERADRMVEDRKDNEKDENETDVTTLATTCASSIVLSRLWAPSHGGRHHLPTGSREHPFG